MTGLVPFAVAESGELTGIVQNVRQTSWSEATNASSNVIVHAPNGCFLQYSTVNTSTRIERTVGLETSFIWQEQANCGIITHDTFLPFSGIPTTTGIPVYHSTTAPLTQITMSTAHPRVVTMINGVVVSTNIVTSHCTPYDLPPIDPAIYEQEKRNRIRRERTSVKTAKGSIKRALKLISNFGMEEDARIFIGGDEIEVCHPESPMKFVLSKYRNSIIEKTTRPGYSTPYRLRLVTKDDTHIANLCVYMDETPLLDQVFALAMFVKTGNEEEILRKANWSSCTNDAELRKRLVLANPYLELKLSAQRPGVDPNACTPDEYEHWRESIQANVLVGTPIVSSGLVPTYC